MKPIEGFKLFSQVKTHKDARTKEIYPQRVSNRFEVSLTLLKSGLLPTETQMK